MNSSEKPMKTAGCCKRMLPMLPKLTRVLLRRLLKILNKVPGNTVNTSNILELNGRSASDSVSPASGVLLSRGISKRPPLEALS